MAVNMEQMKHQEIFSKNILPSGSQMYVVFRKIKAINKGSPHIQMFNRKEDWEFKSKETSFSSNFDEKGLMVLSHKRGYFITYSVAATKAIVLLSKSAVASLKPIKVHVTWERGILQSMEFQKRISTTGKVDVLRQYAKKLDSNITSGE